MAEGDGITEPTSDDGQVPDGSSPTDSTTDGAPVVTDGQPADGGQPDGPTTKEETFFDPESVDEALLPAYKGMQAAFTKKMQGLSEGKQKIEAFDKFQADPVGQMQGMAKQFGYSLTRAEAEGAIKDQSVGKDWEPQSWAEVQAVIKNEAQTMYEKAMSDITPTVQGLHKDKIEKELADIDPTWMKYEDEMKGVLERHPSLHKDAGALYKLSVPKEVLESQMTQKVLKKYEEKLKSSKISGKSTTTENKPDLNKKRSFADAVKFAKNEIAEGRGYG